MHTSRTLLLIGCAALALTAATPVAAAGNTATTSAAASVAVFAPFSVVKETDLLFGRVIRPSTGKTTTYTVSEANGASSTAGGDGAFTGGGGSPGRATFTVYGTGGAAYTISTDATVVSNGVTINLVKSAGGGTLGAGSTGTATFGVGGNIVLTDTAPSGLHSGTFTVTVDYP